MEMWDLPSANRAAEEGLRQTALLAGDVTRGAYFKPYLLVQLGRIHSALGDGQADGYFAAGIEAARASGDFALEAMAWDQQGAEHLAAGRLLEAENRFLEAFRLRRFFRPGDLGWSYGHLGALAFARHDFKAAERFTQLALDDAKRGAPAWPEYLLLQQQGRICLARGEVGAALHDFSLALDATAEWRVQILPARSSLISANVALEQQIFDSFIQLAAQHALRTGNADWTARAFQAVEINRAASLRESLALADVWREKLAPEYWETLAQLGTEEARERGVEAAGSRMSGTKANRLRLKLTEMEAEAGIGLQVKKVENFRSRISLIHFQEGLRGSELFLSFELGEKESYLWAVSRSSLRLYRLAAERDIAKSVQTFREAIPAGGAEAVRLGRQLYQELFGQLKPQEIQKPAWLLSLDGALFNVPFAALVPGQGANPVYLVDTHTLQTVSGALLLTAASDSASGERQRRGEFLGVGDPIYNQVDPRWRGPLASRSSTGQLQRLVGSRQVAAHIDKAMQARREQMDLDASARVPDPSGNPEEVAIFNQKEDLVRRILAELSSRDREILTRFYLQEESQEEICAVMILTETQFRLLKSRAKSRFGELGKKKRGICILQSIRLIWNRQAGDFAPQLPHGETLGVTTVFGSGVESA